MNLVDNSKKNVLVFPCGSEIGLEIYKSLKHSIHFTLIGANSVNDHGKFIYEDYIGDVPLATDKLFLKKIRQIVINRNIDVIYPTMDSVITILKGSEDYLGCKVVSSNLETVEICMSKRKTYDRLDKFINTPTLYCNSNDVQDFPVFLKPDIGYGSRGVKKVNNKNELLSSLDSNPDLLIVEYLPGDEYTVDCFSNYKNELLFIGFRKRSRVVNGISVHTANLPLTEEVTEFASKINLQLKPNGAWFFQIKKRSNGEIVLMEVASRFGGSSSVFRAKGINFAELSLYNIFDKSVTILENNFNVTLDRALGNKYHLDFDFKHAYIDFDDTLIVNNKVNTELISLLYHFINKGVKIYLITKHEYDLMESMNRYKISFEIFDEIIHLKKNDDKSKFIKNKDAIFIDDSFSERLNVSKNNKIPVFGTDAIAILL